MQAQRGPPCGPERLGDQHRRGADTGVGQTDHSGDEKKGFEGGVGVGVRDQRETGTEDFVFPIFSRNKKKKIRPCERARRRREWLSKFAPECYGSAWRGERAPEIPVTKSVRVN